MSVVISEKLKSPVRCIFEQDRVLLSAKTANGDAKDVCRIDGNGQAELIEGITGLDRITGGDITLCGKEITHQSVRRRADR